MVKIEAETLESAYSKAAEKLSCSITQLNIEVIQTPKNGFLGMFKKQAIIVATSNVIEETDKISGQSGNTGSQALAVTMRGLALREISVSQWFVVARKEIMVGIINGAYVFNCK